MNTVYKYELQFTELEQFEAQYGFTLKKNIHNIVTILLENHSITDTLKLAWIINKKHNDNFKFIKIKFWFKRVNESTWSTEFNSGLINIKKSNWIIKMVHNLKLQNLTHMKFQLIFQ